MTAKLALTACGILAALCSVLFGMVRANGDRYVHVRQFDAWCDSNDEDHQRIREQLVAIHATLRQDGAALRLRLDRMTDVKP